MSEGSKSITITFTATGWVDRVIPDKFSTQIVLRMNESEEGIKYPQRMIIGLSKKLAETYVPAVGDKIEATVMPWLNKGVSKSSGKEYCIGKLIATKATVLVPASTESSGEDAGGGDPDELPF